MKRSHRLSKMEKEIAYEKWEYAHQGIGKLRLYHSGDPLPKSGWYTVHNRLGKLMLLDAMLLQAGEGPDGAPKRFPQFGRHPAWYLHFGEIKE